MYSIAVKSLELLCVKKASSMLFGPNWVLINWETLMRTNECRPGDLRAWEENSENCWIVLFHCSLSDKFFCLKLELDLSYRSKNLNFGIHNRIASLEPFKALVS